MVVGQDEHHGSPNTEYRRDFRFTRRSHGADTNAGSAKPVIRTTTRLAQLNVVVLDNHKRPVSDLTQSDFEVFDNGREQKLSHFSMSSILGAGARSAPEPLVLTSWPGQPGQTPGTVTILLADEMLDQDAQASYYRTVLQSARLQVLRFLATLQPGQQVALYVLRADGVAVIQELTETPPH